MHRLIFNVMLFTYVYILLLNKNVYTFNVTFTHVDQFNFYSNPLKFGIRSKIYSFRRFKVIEKMHYGPRSWTY